MDKTSAVTQTTRGTTHVHREKLTHSSIFLKFGDQVSVTDGDNKTINGAQDPTQTTRAKCETGAAARRGKI